MSDDKPVEVLKAENEALRRRLAEAEAKLKSNAPAPAADAAAVNPNLMRLIAQKDQALADYTAELESRTTALQTTVDELNAKNIEATHNLKTIELYKAIVENEPSAIFGLDTSKMVVLFNQGAIKLLGDTVRGAVFSPVDSLGLQDIHPDILRWIDEVIDTREMREGTVEATGEYNGCYFLVYPLVDGDDLRGVIVRVSK